MAKRTNDAAKPAAVEMITVRLDAPIRRGDVMHMVGEEVCVRADQAAWLIAQGKAHPV